MFRDAYTDVRTVKKGTEVISVKSQVGDSFRGEAAGPEAGSGLGAGRGPGLAASPWCPLCVCSLYHVLALVAQLCPTLCDPMAVAHQAPLSVHGILQARTLE